LGGDEHSNRKHTVLVLVGTGQRIIRATTPLNRMSEVSGPCVASNCRSSTRLAGAVSRYENESGASLAMIGKASQRHSHCSRCADGCLRVARRRFIARILVKLPIRIGKAGLERLGKRATGKGGSSLAGPAR